MKTALRTSDLLDTERFLRSEYADSLALSGQALQGKGELFAKSAEALVQGGLDEQAEVCAFFVPGRIEVLGKHTDYAGGRTLVTAVDRGVCVVASARKDRNVRVRAVRDGQECEFELAGDIVPRLGDWSNYPMTVGRRVARNFPGDLRGAEIAFASDLPAAAGMSSSSAFMIAVFLVLADVNRLSDRSEYRDSIAGPESLAGYLATIENGQSFGSMIGDKGVGTFGGSEDHTAILCCREGQLSQYSYCPVQFERCVKMPGGYVFAVASSGVVAEKTGAARQKYNRASALASTCTRLWNEATNRNDAHLTAALASGGNAGDRLHEILRDSRDETFSPGDLVGRFEHFRGESEDIIPQAGDALGKGDLGTFGRMVDLSQALAETLLGTQVPETVFLAREARQLGAVAASAFGAGFGGSVWALVAEDGAMEFLDRWGVAYTKAFPEPAGRGAFFLSYPGPAASKLS